MTYYQTPTTITVRDEEGTITFDRSDLLKYSGHAHVIASGVVLRLLERAFNELSPNEPPQRSEIKVLSAFPGLGVRDGFELVCRTLTRGAYILDTEAGKDTEAPITAIGGRMYFEISYRTKTLAFILDPKLFDSTWVENVASFQKGAATKELHAKYVAYKYAFLGKLLTHQNPFSRVYEVTNSKLNAI